MKTNIRQECRSFFEYGKEVLTGEKYQKELVIGLLIIISLVSVSFAFASVQSRSDIQVIYSLDKRQNDQEIIKLINNADKYVYFAIYFFTKKDIASALIRAKERGLVVWGIMDRGASLESNKEVLESLKSAEVVVETQKHQEGIMHMKTIVTDKAYASGSYNWTASATQMNDEVLEIGTDEGVRKQYLDLVKRILLVNQ